MTLASSENNMDSDKVFMVAGRLFMCILWKTRATDFTPCFVVHQCWKESA
jgi:hypothetical protein